MSARHEGCGLQVGQQPASLTVDSACSLTSTAASMSSASVPSAALVLLLMVLSTIGVPAGEASLLFAVDWFV